MQHDRVAQRRRRPRDRQRRARGVHRVPAAAGARTAVAARARGVRAEAEEARRAAADPVDEAAGHVVVGVVLPDVVDDEVAVVQRSAGARRGHVRIELGQSQAGLRQQVVLDDLEGVPDDG